ncbi:hypothetical protein GCM10011366_13870 [Ornithinimicrobium tianjinense]|uniref:CsbD-like domain-containing protein n=2 Tax=Ornithinimicrobium tianjinense TaxID=1195761 RepID=A0A917F4C7_9MICO|nr:hypothetical protein GCM10011366_13870 [Ornithinimicrobium tianjinense]
MVVTYAELAQSYQPQARWWAVVRSAAASARTTLVAEVMGGLSHTRAVQVARHPGASNSGEIITHRRREKDMGLGDKISNAAQEAMGKTKEGVGDATDNERLQAEGVADQVEADVKQAGEHAKDAWKDATDR